jgi:EmrB/QacA subfamily drug resistance transporter
MLNASPGRGIVLFTNSLTLLFLTTIFSAVNIALPQISRDFNADVILLGWVNSAGFISSAVVLIPFGRISDIIGIKKMYGYGMILYTLTCALSAASTSVEMLIATRAIQGISIAMVVGNATAIIANVFQPGERGKALGITSAFVYVGLAVGPLLGGLLTEVWGWRSIFIFNIPIGLISIWLIFGKIKGEWRGGRGEKLDVVGSLIFSLGFITFMYGFSILNEILGIILTIAGILVLGVFLIWEKRVASPLIEIDLFRNNKPFIFSNIAALINYAATYATVYLLSLYLQDIKGLSPATAGLVLLAQPAIQACLSPLTGRLSDRVEPRVVSSIGMAVTCLGLIVFSFLTAGTPLILIIGILAVMGIGLALFVSPNTNAVMSSVDSRIYGVASAMVNTARQTGQMFSMGISMVVLAIIMGRVQITSESAADFVTSARVAFAVFAVLGIGAIMASLVRGKIRERAI